MPRFVVLEHATPAGDARGLHWDFMLESNATLRTWALPQSPAPGCIIECQRLADHRAAYLNYEGPISGDRGSVRRFDTGDYEITAETAEELQCELRGVRLRGTARLVLAAPDAQRWRFEFVGA